MSDFKSKLPGFQEFISLSSKFITDMKNSVSEIVETYKQNRAAESAESQENVAEKTEPKDKV